MAPLGRLRTTIAKPDQVCPGRDQREDEPKPDDDEREDRDEQQRGCRVPVARAGRFDDGEDGEPGESVQHEPDRLLPIEGRRPARDDDAQQVDRGHPEADDRDEAAVDVDGGRDDDGGGEPQADRDGRAETCLRPVRGGHLGLERPLESRIGEPQGQRVAPRVRQGLHRPKPTLRPIGVDQLGCVTRMSSSSTSTRLPGPPSAATNRRWTVCPTNASIDTEAVRHAPSTSTGRPRDAEDLDLAAVGALDDRAERIGRRSTPRCGRRRRRRSAAGRSPAGSVMAGERTRRPAVEVVGGR